MKVVVLHGSPKGSKSITYQYIRYMMLKHPEHGYHIHCCAQEVDELEASPERLEDLLLTIRCADLVLWTTPVYSFLVPARVKRFIELIYDRKAEGAFCNKHAAVLSTSTLLYDHTTHRYMHAICDDLRMHYVGFFSAEMNDLLRPQKRAKFDTFLDLLFDRVASFDTTSRWYDPIVPSSFSYEPSEPLETVDTAGKSIVVVTDGSSQQGNCGRMVDRFVRAFAKPPTVVNLRQIDMRHDCEGIVRCGFDNHCPRDDGYVDFFESVLMPADAVVFAGTIADRFLSSIWKQFLDRSVYRGHVPSLAGKQIAWIVSGPLRQIPNVLEVIDGSIQAQMANLVDVITDEDADSERLDVMLQQLARRLVFLHQRSYVQPPTFLGVAGAKVCRHLALRNRFLFQADYPFLKKQAAYDLPSIDWRTRFKNAVLAPAVRIPWIRRWFFEHFADLLIMPFHKLFR